MSRLAESITRGGEGGGINLMVCLQRTIERAPVQLFIKDQQSGECSCYLNNVGDQL